MYNRERKPLIFIVYQDFEYELAYNLQLLLESWGYEAFQCRRDDRDAENFRKELREKFCKSDLVLFLLSREFRWSAYCQAEAGTAMALEKPFIPIIIPPANHDEVRKEIAPVLDGSQYLLATDREFVSLLQARIIKKLAGSKERLAQLILKLQGLQDSELSGLAISDVAEENRKKADVYSAIQKIGENYRLSQPMRTRLSAWSTLGDPSCKASIIGNIQRLLKGSDESVTLTFMGVSLKFSLPLITDALTELRTNVRDASIPKKTLNIRLTHMHDQSHILHALGDERDIQAIRDSFGTGWADTKKTWKSLCGSEIEFVEPVVHRIDYIPPRVGLLLEGRDESFLYAGRCAFKQTHNTAKFFTLDVGENEYLFYSTKSGTKSDDSSRKAIEEFKATFHAYSAMRNNSGIMPVWGSDQWISRLRLCLEELEVPAEVTFISGTAKKFEPLIIKALEKGATVRSYVNGLGASRERATDLFTRLKRNRGPLAQRVEQHLYQHPATFRGMVIKDKVIGLQTYVIADGNKAPAARGQVTNAEVVIKIPLCLIITPCFRYFEDLQKEVLTFAEDDPLAQEILTFE